MEKHGIVYFQSGGPTAVINCSLYGYITEALKHEEISGIYGSLHGIEGLINDDLVDLRAEDESELRLLKQTPGAALGSTRRRLPDEGDELFQNVLKTLKKHDIAYVLVNGGNDSMDTCLKLSQYFATHHLNIKVLGIPKTVDNDLAITDHSIGFPSAAKHIINTLKMACIDNKVYSKGKVLIAEVMGRNTGWLTASTDLLPEGERPDLIYIPEQKWSEEDFLQETKDIYTKKGSLVVAVSEGIPVQHINAGCTDSFGHVALEGVSLYLASIVKQKLGFSTRVMELSLPQRSNTTMASQVDQREAIGCSEYAVRKILAGETGKMVCLERLSSKPYHSKCFLSDVSKIANIEKKIPSEFLSDQHGLTPAFHEYLEPLIMGEEPLIYEKGFFKTAHLKLKKVD